MDARHLRAHDIISAETIELDGGLLKGISNTAYLPDELPGSQGRGRPGGQDVLAWVRAMRWVPVASALACSSSARRAPRSTNLAKGVLLVAATGMIVLADKTSRAVKVITSLRVSAGRSLLPGFAIVVDVDHN